MRATPATSEADEIRNAVSTKKFVKVVTQTNIPRIAFNSNKTIRNHLPQARATHGTGW